MFKIKECRKLMKKCLSCGEVKLRKEFSKDSKKHDKLFNKCKFCCHKDRKRYTHKCLICGDKFTSFRNDTKCCSAKCMGEWRSNNIKGEKHPMYRKERLDIKGENNPNYNSVICNCSYCGKEIKVVHNVYNKNTNNFCDRKCQGKWQSENNIGENSNTWNPSIPQQERERGRFGVGIPQWRKQVYERDNYTCQCCGDDSGGNLNAHHINGYNWYKEGRTDVNNGITLCNNCHKEYHSIYGYGDNTMLQYFQFMATKKIFTHYQELVTINEKWIKELEL